MRQNFDPNIWGPHAWFFIETITMAYPLHPTNDDKSNFKSFFYMLQFVIPCDKCRINYNKHLSQYPLTDSILQNRDNMFKWIVTMHNAVDSNKTKTTKETYDYYINQYDNTTTLKNKNIICNNKKKNIFIVILIIVFIILIHKIYLFI